MTKIVILGIDGLDSKLISKFEDDLPNFRELKSKTPEVNFKSVYPHDSETAWASIYTGLNPAKTGIINFKNPFDEKEAKNVYIDSEEEISHSFRKKTFWDILSNKNKKCCVIFPHATYPPWEINGIMISRTMRTDDKKYPPKSCPEIIEQRYKLSGLNTIKESPSNYSAMNNLIKASKDLLKTETEFALDLLKEENWDMFFLYSSTIDYIQHCFWNHYDENDPTYVENSLFKDVIKDFYISYDKILGKFLDSADSEDITMVFSDHGHGMRPVKLVNINEVLRKEGFLVSKIQKPNYSDTHYLMEKFKEKLSSFISNYGLAKVTRKVLNIFPSGRNIYARPLSIDWDKSKACVSDPSGLKAYSYGGIMINKSNVESDEYENLRDSIINKLSNVKDLDTDEKLIKWISRREDLYSGKYNSRYPDIVFELKNDYGVGWAVYDDLISNSKTHRIQPGGHKADSPVFLISNLKEKEIIKKDIELMDIFPSILDIYGIDYTNLNLDGTSIFKE